MAIIMASQVTIVEMVPVIARPPVEKIAPSSGVSSVVPHVGQPAPRAMSPVIMPAFSRLAEFWDFFLLQRSTIRPISVPCNILMAKIGSQSRKGCPRPNIARKLSRMTFNPSGKPSKDIISNLVKPPERRFMSSPKNRKAGTKPFQKRGSLVASRMPLPANAKPSSHFLQFIY